ncbi:hypothetical protein AMECASPLE_033726, partial [Ameca splendens]
ALLPCEVPENILIDSKIEDTLGKELVLEAIKKRDTIFQLVQQNIKTAQQKYKTTTHKSETFKVGEKVLRLNIRSQQPSTLNLLGIQPPPLNLLGIQPPPSTCWGSSLHPQPAGDPASTTQPAGDPASTLNLLGIQPPPSTCWGSSLHHSTCWGSCLHPQPAGDPASTLQGVEAAMDPAVPPFSGSTKVEQDIQKAWDGMTAAVLLSKIGPYKLFYFDIFRTAPGRELESKLINTYMKCLERKHNTSSAEKVLCIDSFGMSAVWQKKIPRFKWDPTDYSTLYGIVNDNHHWFVIIKFPKQRKSLLLDSLGESSQKLKRFQEISRALVKKQGMNVSRWECNTLPHPLQPDSSSCGVFAIKVLKNVLPYSLEIHVGLYVFYVCTSACFSCRM